MITGEMGGEHYSFRIQPGFFHFFHKLLFHFIYLLHHISAAGELVLCLVEPGLQYAKLLIGDFFVLQRRVIVRHIILQLKVSTDYLKASHNGCMVVRMPKMLSSSASYICPISWMFIRWGTIVVIECDFSHWFIQFTLVSPDYKSQDTPNNEKGAASVSISKTRGKRNRMRFVQSFCVVPGCLLSACC